MEETALLTPVHRIIGGIEVEHQLVRRGLERGDEGLDHRAMRRPRPIPIRRPVETAHRGWAWAAHVSMVETFIASFEDAPDELVLDFDATAQACLAPSMFDGLR